MGMLAPGSWWSIRGSRRYSKARGSLFIMGGVFVIETLSVMLQVTYYKYTKKRFGRETNFKNGSSSSPFEETGWKETQVVVRFWIITMILVLIGLATLKIR